MYSVNRTVLIARAKEPFLEWVRNLPDPTDEPPSVTNVTIDEDTYYYRGRTFTKIAVTFDPPTNYDELFDHCEVYLSYDDSEWEKGASGFGYGDKDDATELPETISVFTLHLCF